MVYLRINVSISVIMKVLNPEDSVLNLHNLITKNKGISFISTNLGSILGSLKNKSISYFTSASKSILSLSTDCTSISECEALTRDLTEILDRSLKTLSPKSIDMSEYTVRYEVRIPINAFLDHTLIDEELRRRGFLRITKEVKKVDTGFGISDVITYTYKFISKKLNIILVTIIYVKESNSLGIRVIANVRTYRYNPNDVKSYINELIGVCYDVVTIATNLYEVR